MVRLGQARAPAAVLALAAAAAPHAVDTYGRVARTALDMAWQSTAFASRLVIRGVLRSRGLGSWDRALSDVTRDVRAIYNSQQQREWRQHEEHGQVPLREEQVQQCHQRSHHQQCYQQEHLLQVRGRHGP
eukprot:8708459-Alexandrium_andersonii.AAC.1